MGRQFTSTNYIGFAPQTWDTWVAPAVYGLGRRAATGVFHTMYYAGVSGGSVNGNIQAGVNATNDMYYGATSFAGTVLGSSSATNLFGAAKATGTATPRADYNGNGAPFITSWVHSNMAATEANPSTTASAIEEIGRWNGASDYWNGDFEWVGIWNLPSQLTGNQSEGFIKIGPRFLAGFLHGCQRFWWFNQNISDTVADRSGKRADQIAISGTVPSVTNLQLYPGLLGTTFDVVPGVL